MSGLERLRLSSKRSEASSLLAIESPEALAALGATGAWWTCHDEGDLDTMISIVTVSDEKWEVQPVRLDTDDNERTDAEALARHHGNVFVFGSGFTNKSGEADRRRSFVARFSEQAVIAGSTSVDLADLGRALNDAVTAALDDVDLLEADATEDLINIEGAAFVGDDLLLGLRWPVSEDGQPVLVRLIDAAPVLAGDLDNAHRLGGLRSSAHVVDVGASPKRPAGIRGMTVSNGALHVVIGQTERDLAAKKVKAAAARHVRVEALGSARVVAVDIDQFEGFRKVEGVAPAPGGGWLYALDDEDAVVLVLSTN